MRCEQRGLPIVLLGAGRRDRRRPKATSQGSPSCGAKNVEDRSEGGAHRSDRGGTDRRAAPSARSVSGDMGLRQASGKSFHMDSVAAITPGEALAGNIPKDAPDD